MGTELTGQYSAAKVVDPASVWYGGRCPHERTDSAAHAWSKASSLQSLRFAAVLYISRPIGSDSLADLKHQQYTESHTKRAILTRLIRQERSTVAHVLLRIAAALYNQDHHGPFSCCYRADLAVKLDAVSVSAVFGPSIQPLRYRKTSRILRESRGRIRKASLQSFRHLSARLFFLSQNASVCVVIIARIGLCGVACSFSSRIGYKYIFLD